MKRVVITKTRQIRIEETPRPERGKDEALLKVHYVGICAKLSGMPAISDRVQRTGALNLP
jgi:hypothetical protein